MTKEAALNNFFNSFLTAYEVNTVPDEAPFPYITYDVVLDTFNSQVLLTCDLWYRGTSWISCNSKAREIQQAVGRGGKIIPCDGGVIWIMADTPFAQNMSDPDDDMIRRKYIRFLAEYITE